MSCTVNSYCEPSLIKVNWEKGMYPWFQSSRNICLWKILDAFLHPGKRFKVHLSAIELLEEEVNKPSCYLNGRKMSTWTVSFSNFFSTMTSQELIIYSWLICVTCNVRLYLIWKLREYMSWKPVISVILCHWRNQCSYVPLYQFDINQT